MSKHDRIVINRRTKANELHFVSYTDPAGYDRYGPFGPFASEFEARQSLPHWAMNYHFTKETIQ